MARDPYRYFRVEARDLADQLGTSVLELERTGGSEIVARLLRLAHTLKGAARVVRLSAIADNAHGIEDVLEPFRDGTAAISSKPIGEVLKHLDNISLELAGLSQPEQPVADLSQTGPEVTADDTHELDTLLDEIADTGTELRSLEGLASDAKSALHLVEEIGDGLRSALRSGAHDRRQFTELHDQLTALERGLERVNERATREWRHVHDAAERLRLVPARTLLAAAERAARDSANALGREIVFSSAGGEIRLDAAIIRVVQDALVQLVRNAVAHGVEPRADRLAAGKPQAGHIAVAVARSGRRIIFRCEDDGGGIDTIALRQAALRQGRTLAEIDHLEAQGLAQLLMNGRASTAPILSEVAGRGIGMDIVRDTVERLGAQVDVTTERGRFTRFEINAPLTMSSVEALRVDVGGLEVGLPLSAVRATLRLAASDIHRSAKGEAIVRDGRSIPLVRLDAVLGRAGMPRRETGRSAILVDASGHLVAFCVARIIGPASMVLRALPALAQLAPTIGGVSLEVDGRPVLVLDPENLVTSALAESVSPPAGEAARHRLLVIDDSLTTRMLEQSILESAGFEVDVAVSAEDGLERVRERNDYALVLVDVEMPGMDGFGFVQQLRRDARLRDLPAILVTSRNAPEDKRRGRDVGAQHYIVKSEFDQAELVARIRELVA